MIAFALHIHRRIYKAIWFPKSKLTICIVRPPSTAPRYLTSVKIPLLDVVLSAGSLKEELWKWVHRRIWAIPIHLSITVGSSGCSTTTAIIIITAITRWMVTGSESKTDQYFVTILCTIQASFFYHVLHSLTVIINTHVLSNIKSRCTVGVRFIDRGICTQTTGFIAPLGWHSIRLGNNCIDYMHRNV